MKNWPTQDLGEIASIIMGQSPPGDTYNTEGRGLPFFQGKAEFGEEYPEIRKWCDTPGKVAERGDILLSVRAPVGPTNIARERSCIGRGLAAIRPKRDVLSPRFLRYFFTLVEPDIARLGAGSTFSAIGRSAIESLKIPLPSLGEQDRITQLLDEGDALKRLRSESSDLSDRLRNSLFIEMFGDPGTNPRNWPTALLGDVIYTAKDGPHISPNYAESGVPFLSTRNVRAGRIIWDDLKYISPDEAKLHWRKCKPERGDVLYTKGGTTGLAKAVDFDTEVAVWVHIAVLKTNADKVDPAWLETMLNTEYCYAQSQALTHGIANRDLGLKRMVDIEIYLPPLGSQQVFSNRMAKIAELQTTQTLSQQQLSMLFSSLLYTAFQGRL